MELAYRLLIYFVAMIGPTVLFLGLMRGLEWLRDDALLVRIAESDDAPPDVSEAAAHALGTGSVRTDGGDGGGSGGVSESVVCSTCGEPNETESTYCRECVGKLG